MCVCTCVQAGEERQMGRGTDSTIQQLLTPGNASKLSGGQAQVPLTLRMPPEVRRGLRVPCKRSKRFDDAPPAPL